MSDCTGCQNLSNPTHQGTIVQDVRTCLISHTPRDQGNVSDCTGCQNLSNPDTPRDQGNVMDCIGCQNLSNPTLQGTREMCWIVQDVRTCLIRHTKGREMCRIVQDVRTCLIRHTKGPGKCVRLYRMSEPV